MLELPFVPWIPRRMYVKMISSLWVDSTHGISCAPLMVNPCCSLVLSMFVWFCKNVEFISKD